MKPPGYVVVGKGDIRWQKPLWKEDGLLRLTVHKNSNLASLDCAEGEELWLILCFLAYADRGEAAVLLNTRDFQSKGQADQGILFTERDGTPVRYLGGNFRRDPLSERPENAFIAITGLHQLRPEQIKRTLQIEVPIRTDTFSAPECPIELYGAGRLAAKLQKRSPSGGATISNVVDLEALFIPPDDEP